MNDYLTTSPTTDPAQLLRYRDRQYGAELIAAALIQLDFFTWLGENAGVSLADICEHFGFETRPTDVMLTLLRANGFIATDADGRTFLSPMGKEHLTKDSPWYLGPYYAPIGESQITKDYLKVLRTGKPANWQAQSDASDWHESMQDPAFAQSFTDLMNCRGLAFGQALAKSLTPLLEGRTHLLDVGGGSGIYSSTMVAAHPHLRATVLEQPPVDEITRREIERHELSERILVQSGDMFEVDWASHADVLLFSNVLHDWDVPEVRQLLEKAAVTLPSGGLLVIHDAFIADDKAGPLPVAEYSALLMNITQGKCYSAREYGEILEDLGFEAGTYTDTIADRGYLTAIRK